VKKTAKKLVHFQGFQPVTDIFWYCLHLRKALTYRKQRGNLILAYSRSSWNILKSFSNISARANQGKNLVIFSCLTRALAERLPRSTWVLVHYFLLLLETFYSIRSKACGEKIYLNICMSGHVLDYHLTDMTVGCILAGVERLIAIFSCWFQEFRLLNSVFSYKGRTINFMWPTDLFS